MAEIKNSFLQSKMNKDLDDRLIPNGQYRDAWNVAIGKNEDSDVGTVENILGNATIYNWGNPELVCIGQFVDNETNTIYQFLTDYTDPTPGLLTKPDAGYDMRICAYNVNSGQGTVLVSGLFLNFANNKEFAVIGVNLIENLLFWTDNRNQPRKINVNSALLFPATSPTPYYTREEQISVAKYAPVTPINLVKTINVISTSDGLHPTTAPFTTTFTTSLQDAASLEIGMTLISVDASIGKCDYTIITDITNGISESIITLSAIVNISDGDKLKFLISTMSDKSNDPTWPGDPNFLKDKYIRFSYRYRYDDGEYSLMAPFTQIIYIPTQKGFFTYGDEDAAYRSTVITWMENFVNNINLIIELPDAGINISKSYKISELDILYKESDSAAVKVLETIDTNTISFVSGNTNIYTYQYQSQKPYKTLSEAQTIRVYDKTPVRARAQESVGNRIVYGNFVDQWTPPTSIDYNIAVQPKSDIYNNFIEYPNHTLKQNRNYQVGFILSDKFGRQSPVILSTSDQAGINAGSFLFGGSTIYSPYFNGTNAPEIKCWMGNTLLMIVNQPIQSVQDVGAGTPGLYAVQVKNGFGIIYSNIVNNTYVFNLDPTPGLNNSYPEQGQSMRGKYTDYVTIIAAYESDPIALEWTVITDGPINDLYEYNPANSPDIKFFYTINPTGWYSYKIVVRQQQQDYYNVYLPGILDGYPMYQTYGSQVTYSPAGVPSLENGINTSLFPTNENSKTAHVVLINDNINKVPRDLVEVGPDQKQYRSSVELYGRVENTLDNSSPFTTSNKQYYPAKKADVVSTIAYSEDLGFYVTNENNIGGTASLNFYQLDTHPLIARISTVNKIGVIGTSDPVVDPPVSPNPFSCMTPFLSVYETAPVVSLLDLFWESTTSGLISDLNYDVLTGSTAAVGFTEIGFEFNEYQNYNGVGTTTGAENSPFITDYFLPVDASGITISPDSMTMTVQDLTGIPGLSDRTSNFILYKETNVLSPDYGKYRIKISNSFVFLTDASIKESYTFTFNIIDTATGNATLQFNGSLTNSPPIISFPVTEFPAHVYSFDNVTLGPLLNTAAINGSPSNSLNQQQLRYSIDANLSSPNYADYFSIDPITGVLSLISVGVIQGINYTLAIKVNDAWNFASNTAGYDSLSDTCIIDITFPIANYHCSDWESEVFTNSPSDKVRVHCFGTFNFWKLFEPGEHIVPENSSVHITYFTRWFTGIPITTSPMPAPLVFNSTNYQASFDWEYSVLKTIDPNEQPVYEIGVSGTIRTTAGRNISLNFYDVSTGYIPPDSPGGPSSSLHTCNTYISPTNKNWSLENANPNTPITWKALKSSGDQVIGGLLNPTVTITGYSTGYGCIKEGSLTSSSGGIATFTPC